MDDSQGQGVPTPIVGIREIITIWILFFINLFNYIDRYIVSGVLEDLMDDFQLSYTQGGLLTTAFIISYMILSPVFGFLGDRYKRSILIAIGLFIWASSTLACSFVSNYSQLLFFRSLVGIGEASYAALAPPIIADMIPPAQRTFYLSFFFIGTPIGGALGYIIGGGISGAYNWRWAFRVSPPIVILLGLVTLCLVQNPKRGGSDMPAEDSIQNTRSQELQAPRGNPVLQVILEIWTLLKTKTFVFATLGFACLAFTIGAITQWVPVYVVKSSAWAGTPYTNSEANYVFGVLTCVAGFVSIPCGSVLSKYLERFTRKPDALINAVGLMVASVTLFLAISLAPVNINIFWVFAMITQLAAFIGWAPNTAMILYTCVPQMRSLASAVNILFSHLFGDALSPTIQGKLSDQIKASFSNFDITISDCVALEYSFFLSCFVCLLGSVFYFIAGESVVQDRLTATEMTISRHPTIVRSRANSAFNVSGYLRDEYDDTRPLLEGSPGNIDTTASQGNIDTSYQGNRQQATKLLTVPKDSIEI